MLLVCAPLCPIIFDQGVPVGPLGTNKCSHLRAQGVCLHACIYVCVYVYLRIRICMCEREHKDGATSGDALNVGDKQVVADDLRAAHHLGHLGVRLPVVL